MTRKLSAIGLSVMMTLALVSCQNNPSGSSDASGTKNDSHLSVVSDAAESSAENPAQNSAENDMYRFTDYEGEDVFNIEKLKVGDVLDTMCTTYEFYFRSDGYDIKAYISIPAESIKSQKPCKCLIYNRGGHWNYGSVNENMIAYMCATSKRVVVACEIRGGATIRKVMISLAVKNCTTYSE